VEGHRDGVALALGGSKQKTALAILLLAQGQTVSTERLVDAVWGDDPRAGAVSTLRVFVSNLRRAVSPDDALAIQFNGGGYRCRFAFDLDVTRFEEQCLLASSAPAATCARLWRQALAMFREDPLVGLEDTDAVHRERTRLVESRNIALDSMFAAELAANRHREVLPELFAAAVEQPMREQMWSALIVALYRSGRQAEALQTYRQFRNRMVDELGVEPTPEMRRLEQLVLEQSHALDLEPTGPSADDPAAGRLAAATIDVRAAGADARLELADGRSIVLDRRVMSIGRDGAVDIVISDPRVSRRHATIRSRQGRYELVDESSTNGTEANGEPVDRHELVSGDVIRLGGFEARFVQ
jgi:DNA-binding SARP family transcriptional activator